MHCCCCWKKALVGYQVVKTCAENLGNWNDWHEQTLNVLQPSNVVADVTPFNPMPVCDVCVLVSILLWEGKDDEAWQVARHASAVNGSAFQSFVSLNLSPPILGVRGQRAK